MEVNKEMELLTSLDVNKLPFKTKKAYKILQRMCQNGIIHAGNGWCVSMSDIIQQQLEAVGITSHMLEVDLRIQYQDESNPVLVGHDNPDKHIDEYDTHVVVIADCEHPFLIDASISKFLPYGKLAVFEPIPEIGTNYFFDFKSDEIALTYRTKALQKVPMTHNSSIINRIKTDEKVRTDINKLGYYMMLAILLTVVNTGLAFYNYYEVYIEKNTWGPQSQEILQEKVDQIYNKLIEEPDK